MSGFFSYLHGCNLIDTSRKFIYILLIGLCSGTTSTSIFAQNYITNGVGAYTEFNEESLLIKLELESPATDAMEVMAADTNKKLSLRLMQNRSPRAWSKIWIQNLSINNSPDTLTTQTDDLIAMTQAIKGTLRTGDLVEFERIASDLTIMSINGSEIADFETNDFFEFLMTAFIGSIPPSSELKNQLLAGGQRFGQEAILFDSLGFTQQRAEQIASWNTPVVPEPETPDIADDPTETESESVPADDLADSTDTSAEEVADQEETVATSEEELETAVGAEEESAATSDDPDSASEEEDEAPVMITAESLLAAQNYQRSVLQAVYRELEYPSSAQRRNREGSLRVSVAINANGLVSSIEVVDSAEYDIFNEAAIDAIEDASPFDPLPEGTIEIPMLLEIPIAFRLQ